MVGIVGGRVSFQEGHQLLAELGGINVATKHIEREAKKLGAEILQEEKLVVEADSSGPLPATLYLGLDGTGVPMRASELVDRSGKQEDSSAKTREVKLVTVWSAEGHDEEGMPVRDEGSVSYSAAIESAAMRDTDPELSEFAKRVEREAQRRRFREAPRQAVIGDGAPWIWNIASELFPDAIQIVDRLCDASHKRSHVTKSVM
jgi:rubrerythrin